MHSNKQRKQVPERIRGELRELLERALEENPGFAALMLQEIERTRGRNVDTMVDETQWR